MLYLGYVFSLKTIFTTMNSHIKRKADGPKNQPEVKHPGLTSIKEKYLSYNFMYGVYGKNAYHTIVIQNLKTVLNAFRESVSIF